jgi:streptogramin lyase
MKLTAILKRSESIYQTAFFILGSAVISSLVTGGCTQTTPPPEEPKPASWGLVTMFRADPEWPKVPENIEWVNCPGVDIDKNDHVWRLQRGMPCVQEFDPEGNLLQSWGLLGDSVTSVENGPVDLTFAMPNPQIHQIKVDPEGNIWIVTWRLGVIYKCSPDGKVLQILGKYNVIGEDETTFGQPNDIAFAPNGDIFVADGEMNFRIVHLDKNGKFIKAWGKRGKGPGEFEVPHALGFDSKGLLYVGDRGNSRIQVFDQDGNFIDQWPDMIVPYDLWVDKDDFVWVCGYGPLRVPIEYHLPQTQDQLIMKFDLKGKCVMNMTFVQGDNPGQLHTVHGLALDSKGNFYPAEHGGNLQKFVLLK